MNQKSFQKKDQDSDNANVGVVRTPPHNKEAEQAVLASLLLEERTYDYLTGKLLPEHFYVPNNGIIFRTIEKLHESGQPYDVTMVAAALRSAGLYEQVGGIDYLMGLTFIIPNAANIERYAEQVRDKARLRDLFSASTKIQELVYDYDKDITLDTIDALDESGQIIFDLSKDTSSKDPQPISKLITSVYEDVERLYHSDTDMTGIPTGFFDLDKRTNGMHPGALVIIAGRPAMGKTSFVLNIAQSAAKRGKTVAVFSLEMTSSQLLQRMISSEAEIDSKVLQSGKLSADDWVKFAEIGDTLSKMPIFIDDTSFISVMEIRSKCRRMKNNKEHGLDMVIIDYLQLMENKKIDSREQQISDISRNLKALAKELEVPVLALSQLNRAVELRSDKRPMPSDLRESGAIEQDADLIMFVYRDEVYHQDTTEKGIAEIIIGKHRSGETGTVKLGFQGEYTKFRNLAYP